MANVTSFMGFRNIGFLPGYSPDYQLLSRQISNANATAIYRGDPVVMSSGLLIAATSTATPVDGVFDGCTYTDASGNTVWRPYCPATQTATGYVLASPGAMFLAQSNGTAITTTNLNKNIGFVVAAGTTIGGGFSGYQIDAGNIQTTNSLPFRLVNLYSSIAPSGVNGTDNTSNNNMAVVTFNSQDFKAGQTGV